MKSVRLHSTFLSAAALALVLLSAAHAADQTYSLKFSDPSRPGTLKLQLARGDVHVKGSDAAEVWVKSDAQPTTRAPRKDGLRVLTATSGFTLVERDNIITLDAMNDGMHGRGADFTITVPRNTNIIISNSWGGGDIRCSDITGDIEIERMQGEVRLEGISGGAVVSTMNGEIHASLVKMHETKPLSFTSMNGDVVLRLPADAKADVRLRTQNGSILTDFDESALQSKVENVARSSTTLRSIRSSSSSSGSTILPPEAKEAIRESARIAAQATREAAAAMREAALAAREGLDAAREADAPVPPKPPGHPATPVAPRPPRMPAIPTPSGGHVVTGTLNGGGPEINVSTMNGDVVVRKLQQN